MEIRELSGILQRAGVIDAGSAGSPAYAKLEAYAGTILLNCADREPLLAAAEILPQLFPDEVLDGFSIAAEAAGAAAIAGTEVAAGIAAAAGKTDRIVRIRQGAYTGPAMKEPMSRHPDLRFMESRNDCPAGDDEIIAREAAAPGAVLLEAETAYRIARAVKYDEPVTEKLVTVSGEIARPGVYRVPIGTPLRVLVGWADRPFREETATQEMTAEPEEMQAWQEAPVLKGTSLGSDAGIWLGGPMTGRAAGSDEPVTKTTNGVMVLPRNHSLFRNTGISASIQLKRAASVCDGCERCTDLCPRSGVGYPIRPHLFMRAAAQRDFSDPSVFLNTLYCSGCGICELYACPQYLSPRTLINEYRERLSRKGVKVPAETELPGNISSLGRNQRVGRNQIISALGLGEYDIKVPNDLMNVEVELVRIPLKQCCGAPSEAVVEKGDRVTKGDVIGKAGSGPSVSAHASISGIVREVTPAEVVIGAETDI